MNLEDKILKLLSEPRFRYKGMPVNIFGLPIFNPYKKQSIYNSIHKLKNEGYILVGEDKARISQAGRRHIERKIDSLKNFHFISKEELPKDLIVMYDIPHDKKAEREWFRYHLKKLGYVMIQKSVWVGPSPLPPEFISYVKHLRLEKGIKVLKSAKAYKSGSFHI